jgi:hypothetical protein
VAGAALVLLAAVALAAPAATAAVVTGSVTTTNGALDRTELTITDGAGPIDRYKAVRIVRHDGPVRPEVLLLLPPLGVNSGFYEQTDPHGGAGSSIAGFFALRGYDVWELVARMEGIPAGTCEAGAIDCSAMAGWNIQRFVDDATFVRGLAEAANPGAAVYTGGASLGGILALAVVDADPASYAGAIVWDGSLYTPDPAVQALNQAYCAQITALLAGGVYFDGVGGNVLQQLVRQAELAPGGLTPVPLFPPFLTNMQALVGFFAAPPPGPVTMPVPGYYFLAGDPVAGTFRYASTERVITNVERFVAYSPFALVRDVSCSLAGLDTTHVDNLGAFTGKVLAIVGGGGFGAILADNLALFTSAASVDFLLEPDFGHIDHFMTPEHQQYVERPILRWIRGQTP